MSVHGIFQSFQTHLSGHCNCKEEVRRANIREKKWYIGNVSRRKEELRLSCCQLLSSMNCWIVDLNSSSKYYNVNHVSPPKEFFSSPSNPVQYIALKILKKRSYCAGFSKKPFNTLYMIQYNTWDTPHLSQLPTIAKKLCGRYVLWNRSFLWVCKTGKFLKYTLWTKISTRFGILFPFTTRPNKVFCTGRLVWTIIDSRRNYVSQFPNTTLAAPLSKTRIRKTARNDWGGVSWAAKTAKHHTSSAIK